MSNSSSCTAKAAERAALKADGEEETQNLIWLGILIGLTASVAMNTGQNLEDYFRAPEGQPASRLQRVGQIMFAVAVIANFAAFSLAPASVLAPLEGAQFVSNLVFGWVSKDEAMQDSYVFRRIVFGTALVCVGIVLPVIASTADVAEFDVEAIECFWLAPRTWIMLTVAAAVAGVFVFLERTRPTPSRFSRPDQLIYATSSAIVGGFAVLNAKAISELVELILGGDWGVLSKGIFWMTLAFVAAGFIFWAYRLTTSTQKFSKLGVLPVLQGLYIIAGSISGGIFFEEFDVFGTSSVIIYGTGIFILAVGLFFVVPPPRPTSPAPGAEDDAAIVRLGAGGIPILLAVTRTVSYTRVSIDASPPAAFVVPPLFLKP